MPVPVRTSRQRPRERERKVVEKRPAKRCGVRSRRPEAAVSGTPYSAHNLFDMTPTLGVVSASNLPRLLRMPRYYHAINGQPFAGFRGITAAPRLVLRFIRRAARCWPAGLISSPELGILDSGPPSTGGRSPNRSGFSEAQGVAKSSDRPKRPGDQTSRRKCLCPGRFPVQDWPPECLKNKSKTGACARATRTCRRADREQASRATLDALSPPRRPRRQGLGNRSPAVVPKLKNAGHPQRCVVTAKVRGSPPRPPRRAGDRPSTALALTLTLTLSN